ncbi:MAG: MBL fold metallo-hydrolase [Cystobacterineae bacterium]|nr:MBL fold metallo-hydrolase [Cystobacterineae bacterium]
MFLTALPGNAYKLDRGGLFGDAPKAFWKKWITTDEDDTVVLTCRCLLVENLNGKTVLFEAGIGDFLPPSLKQHHGVLDEGYALLPALAKLGLGEENVDVVVLSHLHFEHAGGLLCPDKNGNHKLRFPNARYVVSRRQFARAAYPHIRDSASYIPELPGLLSDSGRLCLVDEPYLPDELHLPYMRLGEPQLAWLEECVRFRCSDGHTPGLLLSEIKPTQGERHLVVSSDLVLGRPWIHLPLCTGYERFAELLIEEKAQLYEKLPLLFFSHDTGCALAQLTRDDKGHFSCTDEQPHVWRMPF